MSRRKSDLQKVMENFIDQLSFKHFLILNGKKLETEVALGKDAAKRFGGPLEILRSAL